MKTVDIMESNALSVLKIVGLLIICGGFGGVLYALRRIDIRPLETQRRSISILKNNWVFIFTEALGGIGGATAILLVLIWVNKFNDKDTTTNLLFLSTLFVVAGFIGKSLLPAVATQLEKQLGDIQREQRENKERTNRDRAVINAVVALYNTEFKENLNFRQKTINQLEEIKLEWATDREVNFYLDFLHAHNGNYDRGIEIYRDFIKSKELKGQKDEDWSDAHYNRACSYALKLKTNPLPQEKIILQKSITDDLNTAIKFDPQNKNEATKDPDFQHLINEDWFNSLIR